MKKVLALVLAVLMIVSMCACSSGKKEGTVETIKIGLAFPMSGTAAMAGKYCTHGADVLKEELGGKMTTAVAKMADHQVIVSFNPNVSRNHMPIGRFGPRTRSSR